MYNLIKVYNNKNRIHSTAGVIAAAISPLDRVAHSLRCSVSDVER
jgi:hypothetical protein